MKSIADDISKIAQSVASGRPLDVCRLQRLKRYFRNLEHLRKFHLLMLDDVMVDLENIGYSPLIPLEVKIALFHRGREAIVNFDENNPGELISINKELYNLQPGWTRVHVHSSRRRAKDYDLLLLEHALQSCVGYRENCGFQVLCLYLSTRRDRIFSFDTEVAGKLFKIAQFWNEILSQPTIPG